MGTRRGLIMFPLLLEQLTQDVKSWFKSPESRRVHLGMRFGKLYLRWALFAFGRSIREGKPSVWVSLDPDQRLV